MKKEEVNTSEIALTTTENIIRTSLEGVAEGIAVDLISAIPFTSTLVAIGKVINNLKNQRYYKNLHAFINESEAQEEFSKKFFTEKSNAEIGLEILSLVEKTYLEKQARMIARITRMWKETKEIDKDQFDEYANIIMSFDSYLIKQFEKYMQYKKPEEKVSYAVNITPNSIKPGNQHDEMFIYPNMNFVTHGFLRQNTQKKVFMAGAFQKDSHYSITEKAHYFYSKIFKDH
ncbi:hypothetical protein [Acinetobacter sp. BHS4]|uniref:hypothetical protein n=1 Tax=Acinetobacter sp. BHS4 TaxID=2836181 RepID=UPI001BCB9367|nr:hypothetical protein [Acinetobacter sp. BHS4]QVR66714.1 hypothetical protein KIP84_11640 [Acinetobacter sp. BHS4]